MTLHVLAPRQIVTDYMGVPINYDRAALVVKRIEAAMRGAGMALGPAGVFLSPEGITVDSPLTPEEVNTAWQAFDIAAYRTPEEVKREQFKGEVAVSITTLRDHMTQLRSGATLSTTQIRQAIAYTDERLALLIEYLVNNNVIDIR